MEIKFKHLFRRSYVRALSGSKCIISKTAKLNNCHIIISRVGELTIEEGVKMKNVNIYVGNGSLHICRNTIIESRFHEVEINIREGKIFIADHCRLSPLRVWCRFGGNLSIKSYTNINDFSEIRCDENIEIGSFNQISYNVRIWDTNTHSILSKEERRKIEIDTFPSFGLETIRPDTSPVKIGSDCWIGEYTAIFKGVNIGDESIIGYGTFLSNKDIPEKSLVINRKEVNIIKRRT